jgi:hypothetical protein
MLKKKLPQWICIEKQRKSALFQIIFIIFTIGDLAIYQQVEQLAVLYDQKPRILCPLESYFGGSRKGITGFY